jgi:hypothetical protein
VNLRFSKYWSIGRRNRVTLFVEGRNILNHKNYRRVNPWTGDGYQVGDYNPEWENRYGDFYLASEGRMITTDSEEYAKGQVNPSYVEDPRTLLMGVSFAW